MLLLTAQVLGLLVLLAIINQAIVSTVFHISHRMSGKPHIGVWLYSLFFFPGTVIHEMAHWSVAHLLGVRTGEVNLWPHMEEGYLTLGYVKVAKTDFVRAFFIAGAPFYIGAILLFLIIQWYFRPLVPPTLDWSTGVTLIQTQFTNPITWLMIYVVITITHALFPSRADRSEMILGPIMLVIFVVLGWLFRESILQPVIASGVLDGPLQLIVYSLVAVAAFNVCLLVTVTLLRHGVEKIF